jgi:hypothetical protein
VKRSPLITAALCACALTAQAQSTFQFQATLRGAYEVPPNGDPTLGGYPGTFWLTGNSLSFFLNVPAIYFTPVSAYIQGPASPWSNAPVIFDLGGSVFHSGSDFGVPPSYVFFSPYTPPFGAGPFTLTPQQISDLESGLWYVNVTSYAMTNGQVRGQILFQTAGTFQFNTTLAGTNETVSNNSPYTGSGRFSLDGNFLSYAVGMESPYFLPTKAVISGPAEPGGSGALIFDLGDYQVSSNPPALSYAGGLFLTASQVRTLMSGLWYVNFFSTNYPDGEIRGPIVLQSGATLSDLVVTNNSFQFTVSEVGNLSYVIQASTNVALSSWIPVVTNTAPFIFTDSEFTNHPRRFYRAVYQP